MFSQPSRRGICIPPCGKYPKYHILTAPSYVNPPAVPERRLMDRPADISPAPPTIQVRGLSPVVGVVVSGNPSVKPGPTPQVIRSCCREYLSSKGEPLVFCDSTMDAYTNPHFSAADVLPVRALHKCRKQDGGCVESYRKV